VRTEEHVVGEEDLVEETVATQDHQVLERASDVVIGVDYVEQVDSALFSSPKWGGQALSLHASSPGKALLAALPVAERNGMLGQRLERLTDTTITSMEALDLELATVRAKGYAVSRGEDVTYSNGVSAVIRIGGRPIGAIDLRGPDRMVPTSRLDELGSAAAGGAAHVEELLSSVPNTDSEGSR